MNRVLKCKWLQNQAGNISCVICAIYETLGSGGAFGEGEHRDVHKLIQIFKNTVQAKQNASHSSFPTSSYPGKMF